MHHTHPVILRLYCYVYLFVECFIYCHVCFLLLNAVLSALHIYIVLCHVMYGFFLTQLVHEAYIFMMDGIFIIISIFLPLC